MLKYIVVKRIVFDIRSSYNNDLEYFEDNPTLFDEVHPSKESKQDEWNND